MNSKKRPVVNRLLRGRIELAVIALVVIAALSVLVSSLGSEGTLTLDHNKIKYEGRIVHGKMNGYGTLVFENGDKYTGNFKNGIFTGQGTFTSQRGWTYTGNFVNGQPDGKGKLTTEGKVVYEGQFRQGIYQNAH